MLPLQAWLSHQDAHHYMNIYTHTSLQCVRFWEWSFSLRGAQVNLQDSCLVFLSNAGLAPRPHRGSLATHRGWDRKPALGLLPFFQTCSLALGAAPDWSPPSASDRLPLTPSPAEHFHASCRRLSPECKIISSLLPSPPTSSIYGFAVQKTSVPSFTPDICIDLVLARLLGLTAWETDIHA